jgi:hypothetical protein
MVKSPPVVFPALSVTVTACGPDRLAPVVQEYVSEYGGVVSFVLLVGVNPAERPGKVTDDTPDSGSAAVVVTVTVPPAPAGR